MKKSFLFLFAAALIAACSNSSEENVVPSDGDTGKVAFSVDFQGAPQMRAPQSNAIPVTSWDKVTSLQFFLYDGNGIIKFAWKTQPSAGSVSGNNRTFTYADIPTGTYTLAVVANAGSSASIANYVNNVAEEWGSYNVRSKNINTLELRHKGGSFPAFAATGLSGKNAFVEPAEIFMGYAENVVITSGQTTNLSSTPISLTREVSLLRARLNVNSAESGVVNSNSANGVDFTQDASIMIYRLPSKMTVQKGNDGGVSSTSNVNDILSISGSNVFNTADPATGYNPSVILNNGFTMWRDIIVFPNNGGRAKNSEDASANADVARKYFIVVSGRGKVGHKLADGTTITGSDKPVYWSGLIHGRFVPNMIREVNMTLRSGGTTTIPTEIVETGDLTIVLGDLVDWNSNIQETNITM